MMCRLFEYTIKTELEHRYGETAAKDLFRSAGEEYVVTEINCWASGLRKYRFEAKVNH